MLKGKIINEMYEYYAYLGITRCEFEMLFNEIKYKDADDLRIQIKNLMNKFIKQNIEIFKNIKVIVNFIEMNLKGSNNLDNLRSFFTEIDYVPNLDDSIEIIKNSPVLESILKKIVNDNLKLIKNDCSYLFNNCQNLIDAYCILNSIEVENYVCDKDNMTVYDYYINDLASCPILRQEEVVKLYERIKKGDKVAKNRLIEGNLRLVLKIVKKYENYGVLVEDLIQEGNMALIDACDNYDISKGSFSCYAWHCIDCILRTYLQYKTKFIKIPKTKIEKMTKLNREKAKFYKKYGYNPSFEQLSEITNIPVETIYNLLNKEYTVMSLNQPLNDDNDDTLENVIPLSTEIYENIEREQMKEQLLEVLDILSERERKVIKMRYGLGGYRIFTYQEIASIFNVSFQCIQQNELKALHKIKKSLKTEKLCIYTENPDKAFKDLYEYRMDPANKGCMPKKLKAKNK